MLIIGERINTVRPNVERALKERQTGFFREEAIRQVEAGAEVIDVNAGSSVQDEPANMAWLVEVVQSAVDVPLCIDSYNTEAVAIGLERARQKKAAIANSITLQPSRYNDILPLVKEYECSVIGLPIDDAGIPTDAVGRVQKSLRLADIVSGYDISLERLYIDLMAIAISTDQRQGLAILETLQQLSVELPQVKTVLSLTGISFGLPARGLIASTFLPMLVHAGIDALLVDPASPNGLHIMSMIVTAEMLLNRDRYCERFIAAHKEGKLHY